MKWVLLCAILFITITNVCVCQVKEVSVTVLDSKSNLPLIGVNIQLKDNVLVTDFEGVFILEIELLPATLNLTYVGYQSLKLNWINTSDIPKVIFMTESETALDLVTVTGTKFERNISESTISIDIIKPDLLRSTNAATSDAILNKVPGVQVLDGQANIRGGSGYSYGAGSRVMLLIDDIPALQMDAGFPNWNDIPIENLSQIEILKGAASTLYGSAALNGIINFRSAYATSKPETRISAGFTNYLSPKDPEKEWWSDPSRNEGEGGMRYETNLSFVHKQKWEKLDLITSGFYNQLRGFNQNTTNDRGRLNVNLRYRLSDRLSVGLNTLANVGENSSFFLWKNAGSGALQPYQGTVSDRTFQRFYIDPSVTYFDKKDNRHRLLWRVTTINNENNTNQSNSSLNNYGEYQFQRNFENHKLTITTGAVGYWNKTDSEILGDTTFRSTSYAAYVQADKMFFEKLSLSGGLRYEYVSQNSPENFMGTIIKDGIKSDGQLIARFGANYKLAEYTNFRASWGQGYRFPTLTERFVTTSFGNFSIFANPELNPEFGWSSELGVKQGFKLGAFKGFVDVSGFVSEYDDMIEFTFVFEPNRFGFQPQNIGNTRISGYEMGVLGQFMLLGAPINVFGGYTFINPIYKDFDNNDGIRASISGTENVLKYRSKHQLKMDAEVTIHKFRWGVSVQKVSHIINIDRAFESVPPIDFDLFGIGLYRNQNDQGYTLFDTRIIYKAGPVDIAFLLNNILNQEYSLRPALLEAPRNIGLRMDWTF
ncbi:MAG: TonB-dependent receptor [Saprospiraceae bacterium]|nr:TonB-dependent receptor [Saprospiraceae bacterium]